VSASFKRGLRQSKQGGFAMLNTPAFVSTKRMFDTKDVVNPAGEDLGEIEDFVIDAANGRIRYAVLSFGGFLGMGEKFFAVPWEALRHSFPDDKFILDVGKEVLKNAPGFDKDNWQNMADPTWGAGLYRHYGCQPYWEERFPEDPADSGKEDYLF